LRGVGDDGFDCEGLVGEVEGLSLNFGVTGSDKKSAECFSDFSLIEGLEELG